MTPPEDQGNGSHAAAPDAPPAVLSCGDAGPAPLVTLQLRADFLRAAQARRQGTAGFLLQARNRQDSQPMARVGFTASKKVGNAVFRNRAKRRMRALAREVLARHARAGWDYVLVARPGATVVRAYADLMADLEQAIRSVHRDAAPNPAPPRGGAQR